jgi:hypothetical protein
MKKKMTSEVRNDVTGQRRMKTVRNSAIAMAAAGVCMMFGESLGKR